MRQADGLTVYASNDQGERRHYVIADLPVRSGLATICRMIDALPGRWFVDVISSPPTIWRDLQGTREEQQRGGERGLQLMLPEPRMLGAIGRMDLWRAG